jgi:mannose-6-phosphate isomerase-like protein (cupin superfamily)
MSNEFVVRRLPANADVLAPDGSEVRLLATGANGSMAHFSLAPGKVSRAVVHRTVEELWYFTAGRGRMWRKREAAEETIEVAAGLSILITVGTAFQFRCDGDERLEAVGVTMPPWPGADEAVFVAGPWPSAT